MAEAFEIRIVSGARKHGIGRRRIEEALMGQLSADTLETETSDPKMRIVGLDRRGEEIEVVAIVLPGMLLVIHAMPTRYRRARP